MVNIFAESAYSLIVQSFFKSVFNAGQQIIEIYNQGHYGIKVKEDKSPLTKADLASHSVIKSELSEKFPHVPLMSEEGKSISYEERGQWDEYFCVDPLDGTKEFINRNGEFTINLAFMKMQRPVLGVVYVPVKDILYIGGRDLGSYKIGGFSKLYVEENSSISAGNSVEQLPLRHELDVITIIGSRSHMNIETEAFIHDLKKKYSQLNIITAGSSLKFCLIAEGNAALYPRFAPTMEWDTAAGQAIVEGIGGKVVDATSGQVLTYNKKQLVNPHFIAGFRDSLF